MTRDTGNRNGGRGGKPGGFKSGGGKSGGFRAGGGRPAASRPGGSRPGGPRGQGRRIEDRGPQGYRAAPAEVQNTGSGGDDDWFAKPAERAGKPAGRGSGGRAAFGKPGRGATSGGRFARRDDARDEGRGPGGRVFGKPGGKAGGKPAGRPGSGRSGAGKAGAQAGRGGGRDSRQTDYARPGWNPAAPEEAMRTADAEWGDLWDTAGGGSADFGDDDIDWAAVEAEAAGSEPAGGDFDDVDDAGVRPERKTARTAGESRSGERKPADKAAGGRKATGGGNISTPSQKARIRAEATETLATGVQTLVVEPDEADMRLDRFLTARFPQLAFTHIQRIVRKGELRVDGGRVKPNDRLKAGQSVRIPPLKLAEARPTGRTPRQDEDDAAYLRSLVLYEDKDLMVLNKPMGLAVQGGSGTHRHVDGMLEALRDRDGQKPRLVHRLDKDTAGCLVIAKTRLAAATLGKSFRSRVTRKVYWALVAGVPRVRQGRISTYIAKEEEPGGDSRMGVARHGDDGASHAVTYYALVENSAQKVSWLSLKPVTGRTHQLRVHTAHMGHPIVGDPKYFNVENWELPGGIQKKLHLLARRIVIPHPRDGRPIDVTAPLPPHMAQTWNLLGFDASRYDPIVESPEE